MIQKTFFVTKDSDSILDYAIDWASGEVPLLVGADTILTSTWTVDTPMTQPFAATKTNTTTIVWITGGENGGRYEAINHVVTVNGLEEDAVIVFRIADIF